MMRKIIDDRGTGKTTKLVYTAYVMGYTILVSNEKRKQYVHEVATKNNLIVPVITVNCLLSKSEGKRYENGIIVDDADDLLSTLITALTGGSTVEVISLSTEGVVGKNE